MGETKFRGKELTTGEWIIGHYFTDQAFKDGYHCVDISIIRDECHQDNEVNPKTVGQHTVLKDCKGVDIYKGDIIQNIDGHSYEIVWHMGGWWGKNSGNWLHPVIFDETTKIGNIHDNPELLEAK